MTPRRLRSAVTYVEVLVASLVLSMASITAIVSWSQLHRIPRTQLMTDRAVSIATTELEVARTAGYLNAVNGTTVRWYDAHGTMLPNAATSGTFRAEMTIRSVFKPSVVSDREILEAKVVVTDKSGSRILRESSALLIFGGI